jgi:large subunit ribosomal protein L6
MSRIGKLPISIPTGVTVTIDGHKLNIKGPKGELNYECHPNIKVEQNDQKIFVSRPNDEKQNRALHGTNRSNINNMVEGVSKGFSKQLEVKGVGYRFNISGKKISFSLGYSHPIDFQLPEGIEANSDEENKNLLTISGINKQLVGESAARIRELRKPEPYKGKGVRYVGEHVVIKQGKKAAAK